jgi:uncharacterized protein YjiK
MIFKLTLNQLLFICFLFLVTQSYSQISILEEIQTKNHEITSLAYSSNGNLYATAGYDQSVILRNTRGEIVKRITGHKDFIKSLSFSHDGKYLVGGGDKKTVFVWNIETGTLTYSLKTHKKDIKTIAVNKKGIIASGSGDNTICLWNLKSGTLVKTLESHEDEVTSVSFNSEGNLLVSGSEDNTVKIWDAETGALLKTLVDTDKKAGEVNIVRFSTDGKLIASANSKSKVVIWNLETELKLNELVSTSGDIISMEFSPDNRFLITGTKTSKLVVWNMATATSIYENSELKNAVNALAISPEGEHLLTSDYTNTLYIWDIKPLGIPQMLANMKDDESGKEIQETEKVAVFVPKSTVDTNIPKKCKNKHKNKYALIIGNEDYSSHQMGLESEVNVDYAVNDAVTFSNYARNVFCVPEENIFLLKNAKAVEMHRAIEKLSLLTEITGDKTELIVYFAGHGFPDEVTKEPFIMPVDVSGNDLRFAINVKELYTKLTEHPHERVTVFLDACFSGGARNQGLLAARGVKVKPKDTGINGNLVVFSASSGKESSLPYHDEYHGMFTYLLLKKIQEEEGNITYGELEEYIKVEVAKKSLIINNKPQNPQVNISPKILDQWKSWKLSE